MYFINLISKVGLGKIVLIVCYVLLVVTEIDSKSDTKNLLTTVKPEGSTMRENLIPAVVMNMNDNDSTKAGLKKTHRKKRRFGNMVKKYWGLSINTTTSTCTPFFIRRSKTTHRKTTRLKNPILLNSTQTYSNTESEHFPQTQDKGKIKKLLFHKHSSTSLNDTNRSELLDSENRNKYTTANTLSLSEPRSDRITHDRIGTPTVITDKHFVTINQTNNEYDLLSTKYDRNRPNLKVKVDQLNSKTTENYVSLQLKAGSGNESDLKTLENRNKESTVYVNNPINTTIPLTTTVSRSNIKFKKFRFKDIFHFKKGPSLAHSESERESPSRASGNELDPYNTTIGTYSMSGKTTKNDSTDQHLAKNNMAPTFSQKNTFQLKKIFHIHKKLKPSFSDGSTEKLEESDSVEPIIEQTTDVLETQIPSSPSQGKTDKYNNRSEVDLLSTASSSSTSTKNYRKYMHFRNILHRERRTTVNQTVGSLKLGKYKALKTTYVDYNYISGSSLTTTVTQRERESATNTQISRGNENYMTRPFNFKKQQMKEGQGYNYSISETTTMKYSILDQNHKKNTVVSSINADENSNNEKEFSETTTTHNPFKIKYLMQFRRPVSTIGSSFNDSSWTHPITRKTYVDDKEYTCDKQHVMSDKTTTESMDTRDNLSSNFEAPSQLYCDLTDKTQHLLTTNSFQNGFNIRDQNSNDSVKFEGGGSPPSTFQGENTEDALKTNEIKELKKHKSHARNKNWRHNTRKTINRGIGVSAKQFCYDKQSTTESFKDSFDITVYGVDSRPFRNWIFGKTTKAINKNVYKYEKKNTFRWCFQPTFNKDRSTTKVSLINSRPENVSTSEILPKSGQKYTTTFSSFVPDKKFKNFFHFKTSHIPLSEDQTMGISVPGYVIKEKINTTLIQSNKTTRKYNKDDQTLYNNVYSHMHSSESNVTPIRLHGISVKNPTEIHHQSEHTTLKLYLNSTDAVKPNVSIKAHRGEKVKQFFNKFHPTKLHSFNKTLNLNSLTNSSKKGNHTLILNPEYADYIETNVLPKKHKKHYHRTALHNASDVNDTSLNVMAYVMKPLDSLVSVFKALSPNSVTKIGDVNATDIKNGSLPNHLQPQNSSIVILAVNGTNATSKNIHESKLAMALDLLGGMYHCVFNSFAEVRPEDVRFYLYTRSSPEQPEELFLPTEPTDDNATDPDLPEPVLEKQITSESPLDKREIEGDEDDYEDYEFEGLNPAKSEIQSKLFNVRANTKVLIHGYLQDYQTDVIVSMREAYLSRGPYNVVVVDWSVLVGDSSCYPVVASRGLRQVGGLLAQLLNHLVEGGVSPSSIHIVGFSLGAHVAGHAGTFLSHGLVSRITGLDPALPYVPMEPDVSLDSDDAVFVDIIHSAAGLLGQSGPMGHVDFYPNGGSQQPGCEVSSLSCSHRRAALYFIESITSDSGFHATRCESWHHFQADNCSDPATVSMGEPCPANTSGKYYLVTGYKAPFALQPEEHIKVKKSLLLDLFYDSEDL